MVRGSQRGIAVWVFCLFINWGSVVIASEETPASETKPNFTYHEGLQFEIHEADLRVQIYAYIQPLYSLRIVENSKDSHTFEFQTARVGLNGQIFHPNIGYAFLYDFSSNQLNNAFVNLNLRPFFQLRMGQFKVPWSFDSMLSTEANRNIGLSGVNPIFGVRGLREPGFMIHGRGWNDFFEYMVSVTNGEGVNSANANEEMRFAGRFTANLMGRTGMETYSDLTQSESLQLSLVGAAMYNDTPNLASIEVRTISATGEVNAKYKGLGSHLSFLFQDVKPDGGRSLQDKAVVMNVGYLLAKKVEAVTRFSKLFGETQADQEEYTGALNYYLFRGHDNKLQAQYSLIRMKDGVALGKDQVNHTIQFMMQVKI